MSKLLHRGDNNARIMDLSRELGDRCLRRIDFSLLVMVIELFGDKRTRYMCRLVLYFCRW